MPLAESLQAGLRDLITHLNLPWSVVRGGLRAEIVAASQLPRNGTQALLFAHSEVEHALHLFCLNRGVLITPFHNMMLVCPQTRAEHVARLLDVLDHGMSVLSSQPTLRSN